MPPAHILFHSPSVDVTFRRARLLQFLAPWTASSGGYEVRVGRARVVADFWSARRWTRINRPLYRAALLGVAA